jgi:tetratricopeptide (TPR) repeat protein
MELAPECRRPLFLYEAPFAEPESYYRELAAVITQDYELIRLGVAEEGVPLAPLDLSMDAELEPLAMAARAMAQAGELLGEHLEGALFALAPSRLTDVAGWQGSVAMLAEAPRSARVRVAVFDPEGGPLEELLGEHRAHLVIDGSALDAFLAQLGAPSAAATSDERSSHLKLKALLLAAIQKTTAGAHDDAASLFGEAQSLCEAEKLLLEGAMVHLAQGGALLALGAPDRAELSYQRAAKIAEAQEAWPLVGQALLGAGGAALAAKDHARAASAYLQAAQAAECAGIEPLEIEARRMHDECMEALNELPAESKTE